MKTPTNVCKIINREGSATVTIKGETLVIGFTADTNQLIMVPGGYYKIKTLDGRTIDIAKGEQIEVAS